MEEFFPRSDRACTFLPKFFHETKPQTLYLGKHPFFLDPEGMEGAAALPDSIVAVPACVFSRCNKLSAIDVPTGGAVSAHFTSENGILYTADKQTLLAAPPAIGASAVIAPETKIIADGAFWGCTALSTIIVNGIITGIELGESETINGLNIQTICPAFTVETVANAKIALNVSSEDYDSAKAVWEIVGFTNFSTPARPGDEILPVPDNDSENKEEIGSGFAFTMLENMTLSVRWEPGKDEVKAPAALSIPEYGVIDDVQYAVTEIADNAFADQANIVTVEMPASITAIGESAFANCVNLKTANLNNAISSIGNNAFSSTSLLSVVLPTSLSYVGEEAFSGLNGTTLVALTDVLEVDSSALANSTDLSIYVPYNENGDYAWSAGIPSSGNHLYPYGVKMGAETIQLEQGDSANLFEGGYLEAPGEIESSYSYKATPISVNTDQGLVEAKQPGRSKVKVALLLTIEEVVAENAISNNVEFEKAAFRADQDGYSSNELDEGIVQRAIDLSESSTDIVSVLRANSLNYNSNSNGIQPYAGNGFTLKVYSPHECTINGVTVNAENPYLINNVEQWIVLRNPHDAYNGSYSRRLAYYANGGWSEITPYAEGSLIGGFGLTRTSSLRDSYNSTYDRYESAFQTSDTAWVYWHANPVKIYSPFSSTRVSCLPR